MKRSNKLVALACFLLLLALTGTVSAQDGRINPPPYHFGGDTLYCDQGEGCRLLNLNGVFLTAWAESDIATALDTASQTGQNTLVGDGTGTYGTASLWAVPNDGTTGNRQLCLFAFDEWGKQNYMCFEVTPDGVYIPATLAIDASVPVDSCAQFMLYIFVTNGVLLPNGINGIILSIDPPNLTIANIGLDAPFGAYTGPCSMFHLGLI